MLGAAPTPQCLALGQKNVSRPYKTKSSNDQANKTFPERVAACKARVDAHIRRVNANNDIPIAQKAAMVKKLQEKLIDCSNPNGLQKEENDKTHKDVDDDGKGGLRQGQGQLVKQVTPGALRKNPNPIQSLIDAIYAFFQNITNRPAPVDRFMAKYPPQPTA